MESDRDLRLECLMLAVTLASAKLIGPDRVVGKAMEFFDWVHVPVGSVRDIPTTVDWGRG